MAAKIPEEASADGTSRRKVLLIGAIGIVFWFFFMDDLLGLIEGGGLFSIVSAIRAAHERARLIDVDGAGLRTLFVTGCVLIGTVLAAQMNADVRKRLAAFLYIMPVIAGGFILDGVYGHRIMGTLMKHQGFSRCVTRDHAVGNGKSRVWFDDYVRDRADCPAMRPGF